jgi:conjugal transfer mating pair stabilization protein TraN
MKKKVIIESLLLYSILTNNLFAISCDDMGDIELYNGHYYTITKKRYGYTTAKLMAENDDGYLAIPNDAAENSYIQNLIGGNKVVWIGIWDPNYISNYCYDTSNCAFDDSRFVDVKGNILLYTNWEHEQPDNFVRQYDVVNGKQMVSPLGEHWVLLKSLNGKWVDEGNHADYTSIPVKYKAVIEYDTKPECYEEPSNVTDEISGLKCNTQIYDTTTEILSMGNTLDCQLDQYNNPYCPSALAEASQYWDYEDGYSVEGLGTTTEYAPKDGCPTGTILDGGICLKTENKLSCDGAWHEFGERGFFNQGISGVQGGLITNYSYNGGNVTFKTKLRYKCTSHTSVRFEQYHGVTGSVNHEDWALIFASLDMTNFELNENYTTGRVQSPAESWADSRYYIPEVNKYNQNILKYQYMDGIFVTISRINNELFFRVEDTYDHQGWTTRDIVEGYSPLAYKTSVDKVCRAGYVETGLTGDKACKKTVEYTYYQFLCSNKETTQGYNYVPQDKGGDCDPESTNDLIDTDGDGVGDSCNSSTVPTNNCKREKFLCKYNEERPAVWVDNKWQCSPFPCFGKNNIEQVGDAQGANDQNDDGWNEDGTCGGVISLFRGEDLRCRTKDILFGLFGGGCCDKEKVFLGLIQCKEDEMKLAEKRDIEVTHKVGDNFCSKKLDLGLTKICIQWSDSYCSFNSKLSKIIQEQGRPQINKGWGKDDKPDCSGFSVEEFQKLDLSQIDFSEFIKDINITIDSVAIGKNVQNNLTNYLNAATGGN